MVYLELWGSPQDGLWGSPRVGKGRLRGLMEKGDSLEPKEKGDSREQAVGGVAGSILTSGHKSPRILRATSGDYSSQKVANKSP